MIVHSTYFGVNTGCAKVVWKDKVLPGLGAAPKAIGIQVNLYNPSHQLAVKDVR